MSEDAHESEPRTYREAVEHARAMWRQISADLTRLIEARRGNPAYIDVDCPQLMVLAVDKTHWPPGYSLVEYLITGQSLGRMHLSVN
jgi:hypothetical protein